MATGLAKVMSPRSSVKRMPWKVAFPSRISTRPRTAGRATEPRRRRSASPERRAIAVRIWSSGAVWTWMSSLTLLSGELAAAFEISTEIESGSDRNLGNADIAGNGGSGAAADPMQFGVGRRADTGWIAKANIFAGGREIEVELLLKVIGVALEVQRAAPGAGRKGLDVDAIATEKKRAIEFAEATGQSGIGKRAVGHLKGALRQGVGKTPTDGHVHSDEAGGREVRIEAGEQFEVEPTIGREIQCACAGEFDRAVHAEISTLPHEVELLDVDRLIGEDESNGILIMDLYIFDVERNCTQVAGEDPLPGPAEWATQVERTGNGGMSRELAAEIGDPESIEIDLVRLKGKLGGIVIAQPNLAADQQRALLELRIAGDMQFAT